jgi:hypothetical protein
MISQVEAISTAEATATAGVATITYLGRFRLGDVLTLTIFPDGLPDDLPIATISGPTGIQTVTLVPTLGISFVSSFVVAAPAYSVGTFSVAIVYSVGGVESEVDQQFDVIPGGDSAGRIISLFSSRDGHAVLAQTDTGRLVQGTNPRF